MTTDDSRPTDADTGAGDSPAPSATVRSVDRCVDIIDTLASRRVPMTLSELSRAISTPKSTTLTIARTLVHRGLLSFEPASKRYRLGPGFERYAAQGQRRVDLVSLASPFLAALAKDTLETATLAMLEGDKVFNVCRFVGQHPLQVLVPLGVPRSLHAAAAGRVFLAWMSRSQRAAHLDTKPLKQYTPNTLTDPRMLQRRLDACRRDGHVITRGEMGPELFGMAVPVLDAFEAVLAVVTLSGPLFRLQRGQSRYLSSTRKAAALISAEVARNGADVEVPPAHAVLRLIQHGNVA